MRQCFKAILILLLAIGIPCSQAETLTASHSRAHSVHCCGICHTGHLSILQAVDHFGFTPVKLLRWRYVAEEPAHALESALVVGHSRAPPA